MSDAGPSSRTGTRIELLLFVTTIFASAWLIFLVQPMVGKRILPWFGGAPAVWSVCLAFYQTTLFAGYAYAHALVRIASPGAQVGVHALLAGAAFVSLPILPDEVSQRFAGGQPSAIILATLIAHVALPFGVLASTGPLVQTWFARRHPGRSPYPLYAVSNAGSLLALLAYPFWLEPSFRLSDTGVAWAVGFVLTVAATLGCAALARRPVPSALGPLELSATSSDESRDAGPALAWLALSACGVVVLMGVTNEICLDVASVPFLWVMPLAAYLLSFIFAFSSEQTYRRGLWTVVAVAAFFPTLGLPLWRSWFGVQPSDLLASVTVQIPAMCLLLFAVCMLLHGELYRLRPGTARLTSFYLSVSAGGAMGGLVVGLAAPVLLDDYLELPIGLAASAALVAWARDRAARAGPGRSRRRVPWLALAVPMAALPLLAARVQPGGERVEIYRERTFFGVLRVVEARRGEQFDRDLISGTTVHGTQSFGRGWDTAPTTYFGRATAIGVLLARRPTDRPLRVGVIGLGVGTLTSYGREGDAYRFYEIDPVVVQIARDDDFFSFLAQTPADVELVVGDARLGLEQEQANGQLQGFDVLVLDAFSSDAIPVHLLVREAFAVYARALAPDGVMAAHVSNRHFDLMPQVARQAFEIGFHSMVVESAANPALQSYQSQWVLMTRDERALDSIEDFLRAYLAGLGLPRRHFSLRRPRPDEVAEVPLWTDDFSNLIGMLRSK